MPGGYPCSKRPELTARQIEVLTRVAAGMTNALIARTLGIAEETVKRHVREIRFKLGAADRAHAVHIGWQRGYLGGADAIRQTG